MQVTYTQLNKDAAYWPEKTAAGRRETGGHTAGVFTVLEGGKATFNLLVDAGLGTVQALGEIGFDWNAKLEVLITHGHPDHHLELMVLSELYCRRMGSKKPPLRVYCTPKTFAKWLRPVHRFRFEAGENQTLASMPITPFRPGLGKRSAAAFRAGPFRVRAVATDHFPGAVSYVVKWKGFSVFIGWDLLSLPDPDVFPFLKQPSLALIETNTLYSSPESGHTSIEEILATDFLEKLNAPPHVSNGPPYGVYFVHFGGRLRETDPRVISDADLLAQARTVFSRFPSRGVGMAGRLQSWKFG